jgi:outer membrane translocation and assembly module TamA
VVATHGSRASLTTRWVFDTPILENEEVDSSFGQIQGRIVQFVPVGSKNTIVLTGEAGSTFNGNAPTLEQFTIGGLFHVSGLNRDELRNDNVLYGGVIYLRKIAKFPPLVGENISAGIWYEAGTVYDEWEDREPFQSFSAGVIAETLLGPIFIGGSYGEGGRTKFYFAIGRFL